MSDPDAATPGALTAANLALRFFLELAALAALAYWGFHTGRSVLADVVLGLGAPLLAAVVAVNSVLLHVLGDEWPVVRS